MRLTNRDKEILDYIRSRVTVTKTELEPKFFEGAPHYVYKRMKKLAEAGYITSVVKWHGGRKETIYEITELGKEYETSSNTDKAKFKRNRPREWTERDLNLLKTLYDVRVLTREQILRNFFEGTVNYGKNRIGVLLKEKLIQSHLRRLEGKMITDYRITEKGIRLLIEISIISDNTVRARKMEPSEKQRQYIVDANEIYFKIPEVPYKDSRGIKRKHQLNRGELTVGAFETNQGDHLLYVLQPESEEGSIAKIISEIREHKSSITAYHIYWKSAASRKSFERQFKEHGLVTGGRPIYLLPFTERGFWIARNFILGKSSLNEVLKSKLNISIEEFPNKYGFRYRTYQNGKTKYVIEQLTYDIISINRCLRTYGISQYQLEGRNVLLFYWSDESEGKEELVKKYPYVELVPIDMPEGF